MLAVVAVEDVTEGLSVIESKIRDISLDLLVWLISQGNQEIASSEGIELVISPFLLELCVTDIMRLSCFHDSLSELVNVMIFVKIIPDWFSVLRVVTSSESLFTSIIVKWNTSGS